jgi:hypothetical protein
MKNGFQLRDVHVKLCAALLLVPVLWRDVVKICNILMCLFRKRRENLGQMSFLPKAAR